MSRARRTQEKGSLVQSGSAVVQMLIRQPVKEAVREALAEDRASESARTQARHERGSETSRESSKRDSSSGGRMSGMLGRVLLMAALAGVAYYMKQRGGMDVGGDLTEEVDVGGTGGGGPSVEDPLSPQGDESSGESSEERSDEGPTTSS